MTKAAGTGRPSGRPSHLNWSCPKCGKKYEGALPSTGVTCLPNPKHPNTRVEMKPVEVK